MAFCHACRSGIPRLPHPVRRSCISLLPSRSIPVRYDCLLSNGVVFCLCTCRDSVLQPGEHLAESPGCVRIVRVRHGQLDQLDPEDVPEPVGTAAGHRQGARNPGTGSAGEVPRHCVLVAGEDDAFVAVQPDEDAAGAAGQGDGGGDEKVAGSPKARDEIAGEDSQGQGRDRKVRFRCARPRHIK